MARKPSQASILRHGPEVAAIKASLKPKTWRKFVKAAHGRGVTVAGALSGAPKPLQERTNQSLREQAEKTMVAAYKPVTAELNRREAAAGFLETKRAADDAAYRTWMTGEADKLDAQARAADATLATQQADIARDLNAAQEAGKADSLQRVTAQAGNVSDPSQSTALDMTAADTRSREQVAAARTHSAELQKVGAGAGQVSRAALLATAAVREATRTAEGWKTQAGIAADRTAAATGQAKDTAGLLTDLRAGEVSKAQTVEEFRMAGAELGVKKMDIRAEIQQAARKYGLDKARLGLDQWKAQNADAVARAKVQLGYDQILERQGRAAADRALDRWATKYRAKHGSSGGSGTDKAGVTQDERDIYQDVAAARHLIARKRKNGIPNAQIRKDLVDSGASPLLVDIASDLIRNNGTPSGAAVAKLRKLGMSHIGYFFTREGNSRSDAAQG